MIARCRSTAMAVSVNTLTLTLSACTKGQKAHMKCGSSHRCSNAAWNCQQRFIISTSHDTYSYKYSFASQKSWQFIFWFFVIPTCLFLFMKGCMISSSGFPVILYFPFCSTSRVNILYTSLSNLKHREKVVKHLILCLSLVLLAKNILWLILLSKISRKWFDPISDNETKWIITWRGIVEAARFKYYYFPRSGNQLLSAIAL